MPTHVYIILSLTAVRFYPSHDLIALQLLSIVDNKVAMSSIWTLVQLKLREQLLN